jgi:hypothetical protein
MNKMILIFATLLFSNGAFATNVGVGGCNEGSLNGAFSYEVSGVNKFPYPNASSTTFLTQSTHVIGQVYFDGHGNARFAGIGSAAGESETKPGVGYYTVNKNCIVEGKMTFDKYHTTIFTLVLDTMDNKQKTYVAYHGVVLARDTTFGDPKPRASGAGSITKVFGKFN